MNKCKRCGSQFDVLYDVGGELRCIHCAIVNGGVKVKSLDDLVADYNELAKQLAAALAERDAAIAERDQLRQAASVALSNLQAARCYETDGWRGLHINAESVLRHAIKHTAPLTPDTEATDERFNLLPKLRRDNERR